MSTPTPTRVYVAGPLTNNLLEARLENVRNAIRAGERLRQHGFLPFVPHLYHYWDTFSEHNRHYWMSLDYEWLRTCHVLCRLDGHSPGGDLEMDWAHKLHIPVFFGVDELLEKLGQQPICHIQCDYPGRTPY
jgi:hypothetical protein